MCRYAKHDPQQRDVGPGCSWYVIICLVFCYFANVIYSGAVILSLFKQCPLRGFPGGSVVKNLPALQGPQEMRVLSLGREGPLEEGVATHSSILAWRIPWTEEPGRLQPIGWQRIGHAWNDLAHMQPMLLDFFTTNPRLEILLNTLEGNVFCLSICHTFIERC